jgi:hypothetical protein
MLLRVRLGAASPGSYGFRCGDALLFSADDAGELASYGFSHP